MAVVLGKTHCPICGRVFREGEQIVAFPAIVSNENDPLYEIRDTAFHATCFAQHPLAPEAQRRLEEWEARTSTGRRCYICGEAITNPDEHYIFPHFTTDTADPLFAYNYREFHRSCLRHWQELAALLGEVERLRASGHWGGAALDKIIQMLRSFTATGSST